jgi:hypothetical protein
VGTAAWGAAPVGERRRARAEVFDGAEALSAEQARNPRHRTTNNPTRKRATREVPKLSGTTDSPRC